MSSRTSRPLALIVGLVGLAGFALLARHFAFVCDDAYITFRYARNLAEGRGLVFNPGDVPPVEGYSNLLWTLVLAGAHAAGATGTALGTVANSISIACAVLLLGVTALAARRAGAGPLATALTVALLGTLAPFAVWATSGLETMPFTLALFATWWLAARAGERGLPSALAAGLCGVATVLLRADGFLWLGVALGPAALAALARRDRSGLRAVLVAGALAALAVGAQFLWRHGYYGEWLPNTARVKTGFSELRLERGLKYLGTLALCVPSLVLALVLGLGGLAGPGAGAGAAGASGGRRRDGLQALGVVAFAAVYSVYVGGDFMPMARFVVPALPFLALFAAGGLAALERRGPLPALAAALVVVVPGLLVGLDLTRVPQPWLQALHFRWNKDEASSEYEQWKLQAGQAERWSWLARGLARYTRPGESIIRGPVGAVGYFTDLEVLDLNGLVTLEVALREVEPQRVSPGHDKHVDPPFFIPRRPTYLGASIEPVGSHPATDLSPEVLKLLQRGAARMERRELLPAEGFPPGVELRLFRFVWPD